jgi:hypothetical protein
MAPELATNPEKQMSKLDIWSLFVTLVYAMNVNGFRDKPLNTNFQRVKAVQEAANAGIFQQFRDMAAVDPLQRAATGHILDRFFGEWAALVHIIRFKQDYVPQFSRTPKSV